MSMGQSAQIFQGIKILLKEKNLHYQDLAPALGISLSQVKRMFSQEEMALTRLDKLCQFLDTDLKEILKRARSEDKKKRTLTLEQEKALAKNPMLLSYFYLLLSGRRPNKIREHYKVSKPQHELALLSLEKWGLITVGKRGKISMCCPQDVRWLKSGPLESTYRKVAREEFWNSNFTGQFSSVDYFYSRLGPSALKLIEEKMQKLRLEIEELSENSQEIIAGNNEDMFFVFAYRPWRPHLVEKGLRLEGLLQH